MAVGAALQKSDVFKRFERLMPFYDTGANTPPTELSSLVGAIGQ